MFTVGGGFCADGKLLETKLKLSIIINRNIISYQIVLWHADLILSQEAESNFQTLQLPVTTTCVCVYCIQRGRQFTLSLNEIFDFNNTLNLRAKMSKIFDFNVVLNLTTKLLFHNVNLICMSNPSICNITTKKPVFHWVNYCFVTKKWLCGCIVTVVIIIICIALSVFYTIPFWFLCLPACMWLSLQNPPC